MRPRLEVRFRAAGAPRQPPIRVQPAEIRPSRWSTSAFECIRDAKVPPAEVGQSLLHGHITGFFTVEDAAKIDAACWPRAAAIRCSVANKHCARSRYGIMIKRS